MAINGSSRKRNKIRLLLLLIGVSAINTVFSYSHTPPNFINPFDSLQTISASSQFNTTRTPVQSSIVISKNSDYNIPYTSNMQNLNADNTYNRNLYIKGLSPNPIVIGLNIALYSNSSQVFEAIPIGISVALYSNHLFYQPSNPKSTKSLSYHYKATLSLNKLALPDPLLTSLNIALYSSSTQAFDATLFGMSMSLYSMDIMNEINRHEETIHKPRTSLRLAHFFDKTNKIILPNPVLIALHISMYSSTTQAFDQPIFGIGMSLYSMDILQVLNWPQKKPPKKRTKVYEPHPLENLIDYLIAKRKFFRALDLIDNELECDPCSRYLLYKQAEVYIEKTRFRRAEKILNCIDCIEDQEANEDLDAKIKKLRNKIKEKYDDEKENPKNEAGIFHDLMYISDLKNYWKYSRAYYYRTTPIGKIGGAINHLRRVVTAGTQYQVEAYPKFCDNFYASIALGFASPRQITFPNFQYRAEGFYYLKEYKTTVSLGQGRSSYVMFSNQKIYLYTASIEKYFEKCRSYLNFRSSAFRPHTLFYNELGLKHIFCEDNENFYLSVKLGSGTVPDIGDVPPLDQILVVKQTGVNIDMQYPIRQNLFLKIGVGYTHMIYPTRLRIIKDGWALLIYRF